MAAGVEEGESRGMEHLREERRGYMGWGYGIWRGPVDPIALAYRPGRQVSLQ
jgi:hypothetical protein